MSRSSPATQGQPERPQVIVHRASGGAAPENALAGLQRCVQRGDAWAEIDVRRTVDGYHVLLHDATLERTTSGSGCVADHTLAQVRALALRTASTAAGPARMPLLSEALELARGHIGLYLDCRDVDVRQVVAEVAAAGMQAEVMVCLEPKQAAEMRTLDRTLPLVVRCDAWDADAVRQAEALAPVVVETPGGKLDAAITAGARHAGAGVICLALGDADVRAVWERAIEVAARWIMSDLPDAVCAILATRDALHDQAPRAWGASTPSL